MSRPPFYPGSAIAETEEPKPQIPEGEALCRSCGHADVCIVACAIRQIAPDGGVEIGSCGLYLPFSVDGDEENGMVNDGNGPSG